MKSSRSVWHWLPQTVCLSVAQKTLSDYATQSQVVATPKPHPIANPPPPVPYSQPPSNYPPPPAANGYPTYYQHQPPPQQHMYQQQPPHQQHSNYPSYVAPGPSPYLPAPPKPSPAPAATLPPSLAHLPEEQKVRVGPLHLDPKTYSLRRAWSYTFCL